MAAYTVGVPSSVEPMAPPGPSAAAARSLGDGEVVESWNDPGASYGPMVLNHTKYIYMVPGAYSLWKGQMVVFVANE